MTDTSIADFLRSAQADQGKKKAKIHRDSTTIDWVADDEVMFKRKPKEHWGRFQAVAPLSSTTSKAPDIFDKLSELPQSAVKTFNELKKRRDRDTSVCIYQPSNQTRSEQVTFNRNIKRLVEKDIVKRIRVKDDHLVEHMVVRKGTYMINPYLIKCYGYRSACNLWHRLRGGARGQGPAAVNAIEESELFDIPFAQ